MFTNKTFPHSASLFAIVLLLFSGDVISQTIDESFNAPRFLRMAEVYTLTEAGDGGLLVEGDIKFFGDEVLTERIVKINPNGTRDLNFNPETGLYFIRVMKSGNIVGYDGRFLLLLNPKGAIISKSTAIEGISTVSVIKGDHIIAATHNGGIFSFDKKLREDRKFNGRASFVNGYISDIKEQGDKILVGGLFDTADGTSANNVVRLNQDGSIDGSFISPFGAGSYISTIIVQSDLKILVSNSTLIDTNGNPLPNLTRLLPDGGVDNTFKAQIEYAANIYQQGEKLLVQSFYEVVRLNMDGTSDETFTKIQLRSYFGTRTLLTSQNELIVTNQINVPSPYGLVKFNADGLIIDSYQPRLARAGVIRTVAQHGDKLYVGGDFFKVGEALATNIVKLNADGSVDRDFVVPSLVIPVQKIAVGSEGIFVGYNGPTYRFDHAGNYQYFNNTSGVLARKFELLEDGTLMISDGNGVARINSDGSVYESFTPFSIGCCTFNDFDFATQSDGKVILKPDPYSGTGIPQLLRLNADGTRDYSFPSITVGEWDIIFDVEIVENDAIILTGFLSAYNGTPIINNVVKLSKDGILDQTFQDGFASNQELFVSVRAQDFLDHYAIVAYGQPGNERGGLQFYTQNGENVTHEFLPTSINNIWGEFSALLPGGQNAAYITGDINVDYSNAPLQLMRIRYDARSKTVDAPIFQIFPNPASITMNINVTQPTKISLVDYRGKVVRIITITESTNVAIDDLPNGQYLVKIQQGQATTTSHFWKR